MQTPPASSARRRRPRPCSASRSARRRWRPRPTRTCRRSTGEPARRQRRPRTSWEGRPLRYALVGKPEHVTPGGLARSARRGACATRRRRRARRPPRRGDAGDPLADGNVHGGEESGTDAELRSSTSSPTARTAPRADPRQRLVGIIPTQNPDGRGRARQNLLLRHEPRLVRADAETERSWTAAAVPGVMHVDATRWARTTSSSRPRRPDLPRGDAESVGSPTSSRRGDAGGVRPPAHPVLQRQVFDFFAMV